MRGVFMGYTRGIHGVFMGYTYVSGMYRVCIGKVSKDMGREGDGEGVNTFILRIKNINFSDKCSKMILTVNSLARYLLITLCQGKMASSLLRGCCHRTQTETIKFIVIMLPTIKRQNNWLPTIFNDFFNDDWFPMRAVSATAPAINVKEDDKAFTVEIAAPGMTKDDFKVHVNDKEQLVISVEKKKESKEEDKSAKYLRREFNYTRFEQALLLPENVDKEAITAKACSGVLCITLPKLATLPDKQPTRVIDIQ